MRLTSIKLAGFKSFVDPTVVPFPSNLSAIVGPNGCGKSNIIDAVRWVMGESSAKQLRGESLDDVIFNGSATRKPVGQAAIELVFDNSRQTLQGPYAGYTELAIRREITREGQSTYYLNNSRCRRRDIIDIFLGTGMGPRSYAIIEQGMISRLIEAKPEELRAYLEEAAGISKYKERKHETELRISHTQENLDRLNDLSGELGKQLNHLQRQANAAERYTVLKQEERLLRAQILVLRWHHLNQQRQKQIVDLEEQESRLSKTISDHQSIDLKLEEKREFQRVVNTKNNDVQTRYYEMGGELNRFEQQLQHQLERSEQWRHERVELERTKISLESQMRETESRLAQLTAELQSTEPEMEATKSKATASQAALNQAEQALHNWQVESDAFNQLLSQAEQRARVEQTRIQHVEQHKQTLQQRLDRLQQEHDQQNGALKAEPDGQLSEQLDVLQQERARAEQELQDFLQSIIKQREENQAITAELDKARSHLRALQGQQSSLEALQQVALGQKEEEVVAWLQKKQLAGKQRLAQLLEVESGWEQAVETVLEKHLQAICVSDLQSLEMAIVELPKSNLTFVTPDASTGALSVRSDQVTLLSKIRTSYGLASLLSGIYVVDSFQEALQLSSQLNPHESVVTRDGVWLGKNWLLVAHKADVKTGVLKRERELAELKNALIVAQTEVQRIQSAEESGRHTLQHLQEQRESKQQQLAELITRQAETKAQQQVLQARFEQTTERVRRINAELQDCMAQMATDEQALLQAKTALQEVTRQIEEQALRREMLTQQKLHFLSEQESARAQADTDKEAAHQLMLRLQAAKMQLETAQQNATRVTQQLAQLQERLSYLEKTITESDAPLAELKQTIQTLRQQRSGVEQELQIAQQQARELEEVVRVLEKQRHEIDQALSALRTEVEQARLADQAYELRAHGLQEQIAESGYTLETVLAELPQEAVESTWDEQLSQVTRKIERLGPINLAAIDEHAALLERKTYLDQQQADLVEALAALQDAIKKMDRETRVKFKETFDQVNQNFQSFFPRLFGGGRASLEIQESEDILTAGISVMAQPPGKRNSTIHLLSGGEKALTATALVFSFFQLNPAPFCMLDEVDAPLDDANVVRFCNLVKEMAEKIQFIFISHNKLAIEMAQHLAGVTMREAGVSRMVAVDIEEAIALAGA